MSGEFVERESRNAFCAYHRTVKVEKRLIVNGTERFYVDICPICGPCAKVPA